MDSVNDETLFVGTAEAEHVEMYLKAIWHIKERGEDVKISTIAKMLNVRQPSVVQMLKKLNEKNLVNYNIEHFCNCANFNIFSSFFNVPN